MNLTTKAKIRSQLAAKGIYWTDSQIEDYAAKNNLEPKFQQPLVEESIYPESASREGGGFVETATENILDAVGSGLWNALDVATFGLAGYVAPGAEEYVQEELMDTVGGRMGGTIGGLAGFMVPMGLVGRATSLAVRGTKGLLQGGGRAIAGGKTIASATTRQAQQMAAKKIMEVSQKEALKTGGKSLSWDEAKRIAVDSSDDIIGFVQKPMLGSKILGKAFGKGPAYQMEHSTEFVNGIRQSLQATMPERLAANLSKKGLNLKPDQLGKLSDEVVELLATKPFNTIESMIAGKYSSKIAQSVANVVGAMGQEAVNFGIVGTAMDYVQYKKGALDITEHSFADRALEHIAMGAAFGGVKFVPGGTNSSIMKNIALGWGRHTKTVNNAIKNMGLNEAKALGRLTLKNDKSAIFEVNGIRLDRSQLRKGMGVGEAELPALKKAMQEHNIRLQKDFKKAYPMDAARDLLGSLGRMSIGATIFNWHSLNDGAFEELGHGEVAFHLGIGAIMTKGGRPLHKGGEVRTGFHFGERPNYYHSDLADIYRNMNEMNLSSNHIGDIVKQFDGNLFTDWAAKHPIQDAENIIQILKAKDIVYDAKDGKIRPDHRGETALLNRELMDILSPVIGVMKSKSIEFNPNMKKEVLSDALKEIKLLKSESLSTSENPVYLSSRNIITKSMIEGSQAAWSDLNIRVYENFKQQMAAFTGQSDFISPEGKMNDYYLPDNWKKFDEQDRMALVKLDEIKLKLRDLDIIKINDFSVGKGKGEKIELTPEKIKQLREIQDNFEFDLGREFYGESFTEPIRLTDPMMWSQFHIVDYHNSVSRVHDVIMGKEVKGIEKVDSEGIQSLINEVLSGEDNRAHGLITENPNKIHIEIPEGTYDAEEYTALNQFVNNLWSINAAGGREATHEQSVKVPMEKVKQLKEELVKAGMPDPVVHRLDSRMQNWVDRAVNHGIEEATLHLDLNPTKALAVKRLLLNGFVTLSTDSENRGVALHAPREITRADILSIKNNATEAEIQSYIDAYARVKENTKGALTFREHIKLTGLTENQLGSIITADQIFNIEKLADGIKDHSSEMDLKIHGVDNGILLLQNSLKEADPTTASEIRSIMNYQTEVRNEMNRYQISFAKTLGGSVEISRASAHMLEVQTHRDSNGKTLMQHFDDLSRSPESEFQTRTEQIKDLQIAIANKVSERPDISTQFNEMRQEAILKLKHEEIEGHMPSDNTRITPDLFLEKHNKSIEDVFSAGEVGHNMTYDSAAEAIYALYRKTPGNIDAFADRMFKLAGQDKITAGTELRNDIVHIAGLFERRFNVKRLTVNTSSGKGSFENTEISKGFLTELYSEMFGLEQSTDMVLLSSDYREANTSGNTMVKSFATNSQGLTSVAKALSGSDFHASLSEGAILNHKYLKSGRGDNLVDGKEYYENIELNKQLVSGKHYIVGIDENINLIIPEAGFNSMANSYVKWYESIINTDYIKKARKLKAADDLFKNSLEPYYKRLVDIKGKDGRYEAEPFKEGYKNGAQHMEDAMYTIFNVMYGEKIDADWLQDAYLTPKNARKSYKYKRLAQNQGYSRNSAEKRQMLRTIYAETSNDYYKEIIDTYTGKEFIHALVINDGSKSITGEAVNNFITDNRSVAENNLKKQLANNEIKEADYKLMMTSLKGHNSINAEAVNAMTAVRREKLDYLLLLNGQENLIGESAGQKPVGLSSYTNADGVKHVFYNKTHYFYDSRLDNFFKNNKDIDQVAFKSGAKKAKIIDPKQNLDNQFEPYDPPSMDSGQNIAEFINGITVDKSSKSVMPIKFDQTLSGAIYGKSHDVKVMKQFDNWSSKEVALDMWEYARSDLAQRYAEVNVNLYNPEDTGLASREARSFIRSSESKEGISTEVPNASVASIWMEADGVPFSEISKNLYDALIKRKYIDDAGVFDGYTDAGGSPILRGNLTNDLNIPVFANGTQIKLGEAKISEDYLDRKIHFKGAFGTVSVDKPGVIKRPNYREKATLTIAFNHDGRDIIVDLKNNTVVDPSNPNAKIGDYKEIKKMVGLLKNQLKNGEIEKYRDIFNELQKDDYTGAQLAIMAMPAPRIGPHDAMVVKIKDILPSKDGGIMELNPYDVTMRGQRDYDTDKLPFYMDTPFSAMSESYRKSGSILEPLPESNTLTKELDMFSNQSYKEYNQNIQEYKRKRGPVVKMHRKLTYAKRLFDEIGSLKLSEDVEIVFNKDTKAAMQGLVSDSQNVLDIYDNTPNSMKVINDWTDAKLFGDNPFFQIKIKGGKPSKMGNHDTAYKLIVKKVLNDFGNLLNLEGNIYEAGEAKKPRYQDMVSDFRDFKAEYARDRVNWNFYHYLSKKGYEAEANELFFKNDKDRRDGKMFESVMGPLSEQVLKLPTPFMKSLDAVAKRDYNRVRETYRPEGDFFNKGIDNIIGRHRANILEYFRVTGEVTDPIYSKAEDAMEGLWKAFSSQKDHELMMVQANTLQEQIQRSEWRLSEIEKNPNVDPVSVKMQKENLEIKNESLQYLLNKMAIEPDTFGQELITYRKGQPPVKRSPNGKEIVIRDAKTGKFKFTIPADSEHWLTEREVAVKNPVVLKSIVEHELLDGIAFANSTLGYFSHIKDADMDGFRKIVNKTKYDVKQSMMKIMKDKGYRDWSSHQARSLAIIERGLAEVKRLANDNAVNDAGVAVKSNGTFFGDMPIGRETYGVDFLMSMLVPDHTGNPNEYYYSPKTGNAMHAVKSPKRSVINAVFQVMDTYQVHSSHKEFVQNFAKTHRGFYDALVAGRGFHEGMQRLADSNFEGALLKTTIEKAMHNPFLSRAEFKSLAETFEMTPKLQSEYAEMFRQIVQDGALTDPQTAFNIRKQIVENPALGPDAYKAIFQLSRGQIVFDGLSSRQFGIHQGEGQILGEVLMTRKDMLQRSLIGKKPRKDGVEIQDALNTIMGRNNELKIGDCN